MLNPISEPWAGDYVKRAPYGESECFPALYIIPWIELPEDAGRPSGARRLTMDADAADL
jgi:hypothetical protein